jgi:hypothetical protein
MSDAVTVLRARGRRLGKCIRADGTIEDYNNARTFDLIEAAVAGLDDIQELLCRLARYRNCGIVRGAISDPSRTRSVRRLLYPDGADQPTLREAPRRWLALDIDTLPRPEWIAIDDLVSCARLAIETLPTEFRRARFVVQATGGHGLKPGVRIRLWCWLCRPVVGAELKHWLRRTPVDPSVFGPANIIYTAPPVIEPGAFDPLTTRLEAVPGHDGEVLVPAPERLKPPPPLPPKRRNWRDRDHLGGLVYFVETAGGRPNNRNNALYWAARRCAERGLDDTDTADRLEEAAIRAGLSQSEAAATVKSGFRHG